MPTSGIKNIVLLQRKVIQIVKDNPELSCQIMLWMTGIIATGVVGCTVLAKSLKAVKEVVVAEKDLRAEFDAFKLKTNTASGVQAYINNSQRSEMNKLHGDWTNTFLGSKERVEKKDLSRMKELVESILVEYNGCKAILDSHSVANGVVIFDKEDFSSLGIHLLRLEQKLLELDQATSSK